MRMISAFLLTALLLPFAASAQMETPAKQAFVMDGVTGTVLLAKDADTPMNPSSMSKLMTTYMLFDQLKQGRLQLTDTFPVSEKAWRMGGSKMFVHVGDQVAVEDLIRGIVVQSGNDACVVAAEGIAGSEEAFAQMMNTKAQQLGLTKSHFVNSTGWPDPEHQMSARDLGLLAQRLVQDFPDYYHYFAEPSFTYAGITQHNRNELLDDGMGVDGLKTGHTEIAGYGITVSAAQGDRRVYVVVNGLEDNAARQQSAGALVNWALRSHENVAVARAGQPIGKAKVAMGKSAEVAVAVAEDVVMTLPLGGHAIEATLSYDGPVAAPIGKGQKIGVLKIALQGQEPIEVPAVAAEDVERLSPWQRIAPNLGALISGS